MFDTKGFGDSGGPLMYLMKHLSLNWNINFDKNIISGKCVIDFELASNIGNENKFIVKSF